MKIFFGADHAGFELKNTLVEYARELGYELEDKGPFAYDEQDDYPDFIAPVARVVAENPDNARGIVIGGGGQGEAITANRFKGVRAAVFYGARAPKGAVDVTGAVSGDPLEIVRLARTHNDTNVLSLAARFLSDDEAKEAVRVWLETPFSGEERHIRRIGKIDETGITKHES